MEKEVQIGVKLKSDIWREWKIICIQHGWKIGESISRLIEQAIKEHKGCEQA